MHSRCISDALVWGILLLFYERLHVHTYGRSRPPWGSAARPGGGDTDEGHVVRLARAPLACVVHAIKGLGRVEKKRSDLPLKFNGVPFNQRRDARAFPLRAKAGQPVPIGVDGGND